MMVIVPGEEVYVGTGDCIKTIHTNEGPAAKGSLPRLAVTGSLPSSVGAPVNPYDDKTAFSSVVSSRMKSKAIYAKGIIRLKRDNRRNNKCWVLN